MLPNYSFLIGLVRRHQVLDKVRDVYPRQRLHGDVLMRWLTTLIEQENSEGGRKDIVVMGRMYYAKLDKAKAKLLDEADFHIMKKMSKIQEIKKKQSEKKGSGGGGAAAGDGDSPSMDVGEDDVPAAKGKKSSGKGEKDGKKKDSSKKEKKDSKKGERSSKSARGADGDSGGGAAAKDGDAASSKDTPPPASSSASKSRGSSSKAADKERGSAERSEKADRKDASIQRRGSRKDNEDADGAKGGGKDADTGGTSAYILHSLKGRAGYLGVGGFKALHSTHFYGQEPVCSARGPPGNVSCAPVFKSCLYIDTRDSKS